MTSPLVQTKLYVPRSRRSLVARPRLSDRMKRRAEAKLTLLSAPAGFGKTTLLASWLSTATADGRSVAWLSLDESDREAVSFWTYVITALQTVMPSVGAGALPLLQSGQAPVQTVLTTLLNDLSAVPNDLDLVLDDYHLADQPDIAAGMAFLLEHLPRQVHVVLSTRADPALPLARMRVRGELVEVRAADLRFTLDEVTAYLNEVAGLKLSANDITALDARTEGWVAALQLAALSLQGRDDVRGFIAGFTGNDRYIVDYLVEEVLQRQPEQVRDFLLRTSLLDRLSGALCDAVTGQADGKALLEALNRANLFLVPLDDSRRWYRYHHLFADVLHAHLLDERPSEVADLHRRASQWYDENAQPAAAIRHALAAADVQRAADLVERSLEAMRRDRQEATLRSWLEAIPRDVLHTRPVLTVGLVGSLMATGESQGVADLLREAERWLEPSDGPEERDRTGANSGMLVVADPAELARLPGAIQMYWAGLAMLRNDIPGTLSHAHRAIERSAADDDLTRAGASALSGLALWSGGHLEEAHSAYSTAVAGLQRVGHIADVLGCSITLADIRITQGHLTEAQRTYEQALRLGSDQPGTVLRGIADMHVGMSAIACERNDLETAIRHLLRSSELGESIGLPQNPHRWRIAMAQVKEAQGDLDGALSLVEEAHGRYAGDFSPNVRPIPALRARVLAAQDNVSEALRWASDAGLSVDDELSYLHEYEHITLAAVLLAQHRAGGSVAVLQQVVKLLDRLLSAAEAGMRTGSVLEILVLRALAEHATGNTAAALVPLQRALTIAEPEGYVRLFLRHGAPMTDLLKTAVRRQVSAQYGRRLLDALDSTGAMTRSPQAGRRKHGLVEPLSERELDVLRLLASDLDGPDIARRLMVSLNTVRTHTKNIYTKLGVNSRRAAVTQAVQLELL